MVYLPLVLKEEAPPCGWQDSDADEPANNLWESATPYWYGLWTHRTFWNPTQPPGWEWDDPDWFEWRVEWTGDHWLWVENLDPADLRVLLLVYETSGDPVDPLYLIIWGEAYQWGDMKVYLEAGTTYYVKAINMTRRIGCYDIWLEP